MKRFFPLVVLTALILAFSQGCKNKSGGVSEQLNVNEDVEKSRSLTLDQKASPAAPEALRMKEEVAGGYQSTGSVADELGLPSSRMIIKIGSLSVRVKDVDDAYKRAVEIVERSGGYVQNGTVSESMGARADLTIKVNPERFTDLFNSLQELGKVEQKTISGQDVTEEYYDLAAELTTQLALRERYFTLLNKANTISEAIQVEQELARVDYNVNRIKGRMKYLETMVGESTINLSLYSQERAPSEPFLNWSKVGHGFVVAAQVLVKILIGILYALIVLIPLAGIGLLVAWIVIRSIRNRKAKKNKS